MTNYIVSKKRENLYYWIDFENFKLNLNSKIMDFQTFLFSFLSLKYD
jgi:hypothetical protein